MKKDKIYVIGHRNPDADSVCSAIGLAALRGYEPACAGNINGETEYILNRFGADHPELLENIAGLKVALVDHNQMNHGAAGIKDAEIIEIADHHFMGGPGSLSAPLVCNRILGSTATIIYQMFTEAGIIPDMKTAGVLLGAIISDTLYFRSPTATDEDREAAEALALIAETDMEEFAEGIFEAGSNLEGKAIKEIFYSDYKVFSGAKASFGCGALTAADAGHLTGLEMELLEFMEVETDRMKKEGTGPDFLIFMLTSLVDAVTVILCGDLRAAAAVKSAYEDFENGTWEGGRIYRADGILSRKLQLVPQVTAAADRMKI